MAEPFLRITHDGIDGEATVALSAVPGYAARGWLVTGAVSGGPTDTLAASPALTKPPANASTDAWRTYAVAAYVLGAGNGLSYDQAMAMSRDELAAHFADAASLPDPNTTPADPADPASTSQES